MPSKSTIVKSVFAVMLAIMMVLAIPTSVPQVRAVSQSDLDKNLAEQKKIKAEISKLTNEKKNAQKIADAYLSQVKNVENRIKICNTLINQYNEEMDKLEEEINRKNAEIESTKAAFKKRLRAIQMSGDTASITLLLGADGLADFLEKAQLAKSVSNYDQKIIDEIVDAIKKIESAQKEVEEKQAQQSDIATQLAATQSEYESLLVTANKAVAQVNKSLTDEQKLLKEAEDAEKELRASLEEAAKRDKGLIMTSISFTWPAPGYKTITSPYGYRIHPIYKTKKMHTGIDISGSGIKGKPVVAAADGVVGSVKSLTTGYGNHVIINHGTATNGNAYQTLYGHMTRYIVKVGQTVKKGETIGYVGSTGASTGPHLHFEIRVKVKGSSSYNHTDPTQYVVYGK